MLDPEYLDEVADLVGAVYAEIEDEMLRYLSRLLLSGADVLGQRGETALLLLAQTRAADLMAIVERHRGDVSRAVEATVADAIARSDAADLAVLGDAAAPRAEGTLPMQASLTARGIAEVLARDNVDMQSGALALWQSVVSRAVTRVNTGAATTEAALHSAVREMMRAGISTVTYRDAETGRQTVTNRVYVAVRRHVRTQIQQDGLRRTMELCRASGCRLVEVTSHCGARPSHAEWQGNVYGLDGPCEVEGESYRGLADATGYGSVDGLGGANCRHSFGPWSPGMPRAYQPDPPHPSGLSNDEVYRLRQGQRRRERAIRQAKRDLAGAQMVAGRDGSLANIAEVERAKARLAARQKGMRDFIAEANAKGKAPVLHRNPRREWAGDMPRVRKTDASRRSMSLVFHEQLVDLRRAPSNSMFAVSQEVNRKGYHDAFEKAPLPKKTREALYRAAGEILQKTNGTQKEHMIAIDARTGAVVASNIDMPAVDGKTGFTAAQVDDIMKCPNKVVLIHNHPSSTQPSFRDILEASSMPKIAAIMVAGHDSSLWYVACTKQTGLALQKSYDKLRDRLGDRARPASVALARDKGMMDWRELK